jgi:hypothetical protein
MICRAFLSAGAFFLACGLAACSGGEGGDPNSPDAAAGTVDADVDTGDFATLIARGYEIPAGQEFYRCAAGTVDEDMYISSFRALAPSGTHHTVLSVSDSPVRADGDFDCEAGTLQHRMLYASGVGTEDLSFPEGVAVRISAGQQLHLNLHLYNVSDSPISGTGGILRKSMPAADVVHEAEMVFGGKAFFSLSASSTPQTIVGGCRFNRDMTVVALWPHMHQLGTHMKIVHQKSSGNVTLLDEPYDFEEQTYYPIEPLAVANGERLEITCTFVNDTGAPVSFGDSSDQEMCFGGLYRYPATGANLFACAEL